MKSTNFCFEKQAVQAGLFLACLGISPGFSSPANADVLQVSPDVEVVLSPSEDPDLVSHYAGKINPSTLQVGGNDRQPWGDGRTATLFQFTVPESPPQGSEIRGIRLIVTPMGVFAEDYPPTIIGLMTTQSVWDGNSRQIEVDTVEGLQEMLPTPLPDFMANVVKDPELSYEFDLSPWLDLTDIELAPGTSVSVILWRIDTQGLRGATFYGSGYRDSEDKAPVLEIDY